MYLEYSVMKSEASKHHTQSRFHEFRDLIQCIDSFYSDETIVKLYARNLFKEKAENAEFILFYKDKIVKASDKNGKITFTEYASKIVYKHIEVINLNECTLIIRFEDGNELSFNSVEDTIAEHLKSYAIDIKELYGYL